jgi:hypothetical protein
MTSKEFQDQLYENSDKDYGIFPPPTSNAKALEILIHHFLGDNWYSTGVIHNDQVNSEAVYEILRKYPNGEQEKERRKERIKQKLYGIINFIIR